MLFSKSTGGFYLKEVHGDSAPTDAVEISDALYQEMLAGQSVGKLIVGGSDGLPQLQDQPPGENPRIAEIKAELLLIDTTKKPRALTDAILSGDKSRLEAYEAQAAALRAELQGIST